MNMYEMTAPLNISTLDLRTQYIDKIQSTAIKYIKLCCTENIDEVHQDVVNGASIYQPLLDCQKQIDKSKYIVITCRTTEDGLRAANYLENRRLMLEGYDSSDFSDSYDEEQDEDIQDDLFSLNDLSDDLFDDDYNSDKDCYEESFDKLPIIPMTEVVNYNFQSNQVDFFGGFGHEMNPRHRGERPWWLSCKEQAVIVSKNFWRHIFGLEFSENGTFLEDNEINALERFKDNSRVYVLIESGNVSERDTSLMKAAITYNAVCLDVGDAEKIDDYRVTLLLNCCNVHGYELGKDIDVKLLAKELSNIEMSYPCEYMDKTMNYLEHNDTPQVLTSEIFERLGILKLIKKRNSEKSRSEMKSLIGMEKVKNDIESIVNIMKLTKLRSEYKLPKSDFHNVHLFVGAPGTAKTTMAKILTNRLLDEGLLPGNRFISITGTQLKGEYVGQTAPKVHQLFERYDAIFIDEAYSLTAGGHGGMDSYAEEALAQLAVEIEEHATDKLIIFAGYGGSDVMSKNNKMFQFIEANPGIKSRINSTIFFDSYSVSNMSDIVKGICDKKKISLPKDWRKVIEQYFTTRIGQSDFGNGREARQLIEQCELQIADRVANISKDKLTEKTLTTLYKADLENTIKKIQGMNETQKGQSMRKLGLC